MDRQQKTEHETTHNGIAKDTRIGARRQILPAMSQEVQGYLLIAGGILLFLYTRGYLTFLNYALMAGALALILYGARQSRLLDKAQDLIQRIRTR
jgi:hypothetical protein